ncbi:MAG: Gfo/Idh/MocA family oxidoreductase [Alphaproteobacteria bacterium]|nr:Gfo/Idh/MocA family oxidoreductase [Alphaproteobacteria bacterium]
MSLAAPVKVACLGAGYFSRFHYDAWNRLGSAQPVAAIDTDIDKARATGLAAFGSLRVALDDTQPDLLDIITPPPTHMAAIREAIDSGIGAIICQKPFCANLDEARKAVSLAETSDTTLVVHENFRFQPWYRAIRTEVENGRIGTLLQITFRLRTGDGQGPRAYLDRQPYFQTMPRLLIYETGIHFIDVFRFIAGDPQTVYGDLRRLNPAIAGEDAGYFILGYESGLRAMFDGNRLLDHSAENHRITLGEAVLEGTEGTLTLSGDGAVRLRAFGATDSQTVLEAKSYQGFGGDCVLALQKHVIDGLVQGSPLENRASDYLRNLELEEAIYRSHERSEQVRV